MKYNVTKRKDGKFIIDVPVPTEGGSFRGVLIGDQFEFEGKQYEVAMTDSVFEPGHLYYIVDAAEV